jgi:glutathione S-transferase
MMVSVLLRLKSSGILDEYPNLAAYVARGEGRPAYNPDYLPLSKKCSLRRLSPPIAARPH